MEIASNDQLRNRIAKLLLLFSLLLNTSSMWAQNKPSQSKLLITNHTLLGWSQFEFLDTYLSGIPYQGHALELSNTGRRMLSTHTSDWFLRSDFDVKFGMAENEPSTATMTYSTANLGMGLQYQMEPVEHLKLLVGGTWDSDFGFRYSSRDVNNCMNVDLSTNLNIVASFQYDFLMSRHPLKLMIDLKTPVFGLMCVPERGASYYEIFEFEQLSDVLKVSSLHNKNAIYAQAFVQVPLRNIRLNVGFQYESLEYLANNVYVGRSGLNMLVGLCYDFSLFGGRRNHAAASMIETEW
jgi:hypothetical protein